MQHDQLKVNKIVRSGASIFADGMKLLGHLMRKHHHTKRTRTWEVEFLKCLGEFFRQEFFIVVGITYLIVAYLYSHRLPCTSKILDLGVIWFHYVRARHAIWHRRHHIYKLRSKSVPAVGKGFLEFRFQTPP